MLRRRSSGIVVDRTTVVPPSSSSDLLSTTNNLAATRGKSTSLWSLGLSRRCYSLETHYRHSYDDLSTATKWLSGLSNNRVVVVLGLFVLIAPWIYHSHHMNRIHFLKSSLAELLNDQRQLHDDLEQHTLILKDKTLLAHELEYENSELMRELAVASTVGGGRGSRHSHSEQGAVEPTDSSTNNNINKYRQAERDEDSYLERIDHLHTTIQNKSRQHVQHSWASYQNPETGTFRVNVTLTSELVPGRTRWFMIETAPLKLMPHAIDHFLRMVQVQLWDGLSLIHQTPADSNNDKYTESSYEYSSSVSNRIHTAAVSAKTYEYLDQYYVNQEMGMDGRPKLLTQLAFAEHSSDYHMEQYSVVFQGRPGGPNFYIHMDEVEVSSSHTATTDDTTASSTTGTTADSEQHQEQSDTSNPGGHMIRTDVGHDHHGHEHYEDDGNTDDHPLHPYDHHGHYHGESVFGKVVQGHELLHQLVLRAQQTQLQQTIGIQSIRLVPYIGAR